MTEQTYASVNEEYLISRSELLLDLDSIVMPSFCTLLVELGAVVGLLSPFIQFSQLDLSFDLG